MTRTYGYDAGIITMKPDLASWVDMIELPLQQCQGQVVPWSVTQTDLLDDATDE